MKIDDIYEQWDIDCEIDRTEITDEVLKIPKLHNKYFRIYTNEKLVLKKYEADMKILKLGKYEFYVHGPSVESNKKGWVAPSCGRILRPDVQSYLDADPDIITLSLKIGLQKEKIELLDSIIKSFIARGFSLKTALEFEKFRTGVS